MRRVGSISFIVADDVTQLRDIIERELTNLDPAVAHCPAPGLDAPTLANWQTQRAITQHWIDTVNAEAAAVFPSGRWAELYTQGQGLEAVLRQNWWPRLTAAGCTIAFPQPNAPPAPGLSTDNPDSPLSWLAPIEGIVKALLFVMVAREIREWTR